MFRAALISDQHFDLTSRWTEHQRIMAWISERLREDQPDAILLGGDLFERRPAPEEMEAAVDWVTSLADIAPVVGVYGNHDAACSLYPLTRLRTQYRVNILDRPGVVRLGAADIACMPWPRRAELLAFARGASHEEVEQVGHAALEAVLRHLGAEMGEDRHRLFLGHVMVRGSRVSSGQPLMPGADFELGLEDLALVRADAYCLGHIHCANEWSIDGAPCIYPGSPRRTSFGETEAKGFAMLTLEHGRPVIVEHIETPCTPMLLLEDEWSPDGDGEIAWLHGERGLPGESDLGGKGAEVRFRYRVDADRRADARHAAAHVAELLHSRGAAVVKVEEVVRPTRRARAPEIAKAATLADKLEALWRARGVEQSAERRESLLTKLSALEVL